MPAVYSPSGSKGRSRDVKLAELSGLSIFGAADVSLSAFLK